jgi:hypothetical protein
MKINHCTYLRGLTHDNDARLAIVARTVQLWQEFVLSRAQILTWRVELLPDPQKFTASTAGIPKLTQVPPRIDRIRPVDRSPYRSELIVFPSLTLKARVVPVFLFLLYMLTSVRLCRYSTWRKSGAPNPFLPRAWKLALADHQSDLRLGQPRPKSAREISRFYSPSALT